jgi:hypothetical protein
MFEMIRADFERKTRGYSVSRKMRVLSQRVSPLFFLAITGFIFSARGIGPGLPQLQRLFIIAKPLALILNFLL